MPGLFLIPAQNSRNILRITPMSHPSPSRNRPSATFLKAQTQSMARQRIMSDIDASAAARDANTAKLRQMRLAKEELDRSQAAAEPPKTGKRPSTTT